MQTPVREIKVGEVTFLVRLPWKLVREYIARLARIECEAAGAYAFQEAAEMAAREFLVNVLVGWRGVVDDDGNQVDYAPEKLDELDAGMIAALLEKIAEPPEELRPKKAVNGEPL